MIVTGEYILNYPKQDEISKFIKNTEHEHNEKYGCNEKRKIQVICYVEIIGVITNKMSRLFIVI